MITNAKSEEAYVLRGLGKPPTDSAEEQNTQICLVKTQKKKETSELKKKRKAASRRRKVLSLEKACREDKAYCFSGFREQEKSVRKNKLNPMPRKYLSFVSRPVLLNGAFRKSTQNKDKDKEHERDVNVATVRRPS